MNARFVYVMWQSKPVVLLISLSIPIPYLMYVFRYNFIIENICKSRSRIFFQKHAYSIN